MNTSVKNQVGGKLAAQLKSSGLTDEIGRLKYQWGDRATTKRVMELSKRSYEALLIPYFNPDGTHMKDGRGKTVVRSRPDWLTLEGSYTLRQKGKPDVEVTSSNVEQHLSELPKYLTKPKAKGGENRLYFSLLVDWVKVLPTADTIVVVEGEKKADLLCACGIPAIGVAGVDNWYKPGSKGRSLIKDWNLIPLKGLTVIWVLDSDIVEKTSVQRAEKWAKGAMEAAGATFLVTRWEASEGKGIDDVAVNCGRDRVREIIAAAKPPMFAPEVLKVELAELLGDAGDEIERLFSQGLAPDELLFEVADKLKGCPPAKLPAAARAVAKAAVSELDRAQQGLLWSRLSKATGLKIGEVREVAKQEFFNSPKGQAALAAKQRQKEDEGSELCKFLQLKESIKEAVGGDLRLNQLTQNIEYGGEAINPGRHKTLVAELVNQDATRDDATEILGAIAEGNPYSPVAEYLERVSAKYGDSTIGLLNNAATRLLSPQQPRCGIYNTYLQRWMIGAVARALDPGCKFDHALILQGEQGLLKSTFLQALAGEQFFDDNLGDLGTIKDDLLVLHRAWIHEWAEFDRVTSKREASLVKSFITRQEDRFRAPYDRAVRAHKRRCVLSGTVNTDSFLVDDENRRFWVIPVGAPADIELVRAERDQLWAAAYALYKRGELPILTTEESQVNAKLNRAFQREDTWEDLVEAFLADPFNAYSRSNDDGHRYFLLREVLEKALEISPDRQSSRDQKRLQMILTRMGHKSAGKQRLRMGGAGRPVNCWQLRTGTPDSGSTGTLPVQTSDTNGSSDFTGSTGTLPVQTSDTNGSSDCVPVKSSSIGAYSENQTDTPAAAAVVSNGAAAEGGGFTGTNEAYRYNSCGARAPERTGTCTGKKPTGTPVQTSDTNGSSLQPGDRVRNTLEPGNAPHAYGTVETVVNDTAKVKYNDGNYGAILTAYLQVTREASNTPPVEAGPMSIFDVQDSLKNAPGLA